MSRSFVGNSFKILQVLHGHTSDVTSCDFVSPSTIVTGSSDKTVRVWDWKVGSGYEERSSSPLRAHKYQVTCVRVSPQGSLLASSSVDGTAIIWSMHNCVKLYTITQVNGDAIRVCRFSPDSTILITAGDNGAVCVWDLIHRSLIKTIFDHQGTTQSLAFTPDSYYLVSACSLEMIMVWNTQDLVDTANESPCVPMAKIDNAQDMGVFSLDVNKHITFDKNNPLARQYKLASSGNSNEIKIWIITAKFIVKNKTSTVSEMALELFDVYDGHTSSVTCVRYSHNGEYLVSTSVDKLVKVWDNEGNCVASLDGHNRYVNCATISKDLSIIASGSNDKNIIIWDTTDSLTLDSEMNQYSHNGDRISETHLFPIENDNANIVMLLEKLDDVLEGSVNSCCFSGKNLLALGSGDKLVRMFKISKENNAEEHCFSPLEGHTYAINHVEFSPNGNTLASCSQDGCTILWDAATGEKIRSLPKNILSLKVCRFCPDNTLLLTAGDDEKAILWNSETMEKLAQFEGHLDTISGACVSPDGLISVTVSVNADYRVWSLESFACLYIKEDAHDYGIQDCDMSHNLEPIPNLTINAQSYLLVTCGNDSLVKLWRISLPNKCDTSIDKIEVKLWRSLQGHGGNVLCVRFSQIVSEFVCSTATDRQARIWSVYSANCLYVLDHDSIVTSCYFNVDCSLLATGCLDKTLWLWKLPQHLMFQSAVADKIQSRAKPIIDWTTADIIKWLKNIEMHGLIPVATNCCLDGKKLITLTVDQICASLDLDESEQEKFQKEIRWLKNREIKLEAANTLDIPDEFLCPITHEIMSEPVMCSDGFTYEKNAITEWFMSGKYTSPMTNEVLSNTDVTRNIKLRNEIYEFLDMNEAEDV
ncbi:WD repeat, SAM and U-box domain-containing protein 1-like [Diabrotica undecimpunctata]|uniref:WD repeat, SAM and U-box domain-containing protein 1-like n=1 Tax=Diabrotica undecimpunctata TaxID=50387 RepID=UPI003B635C07